MLNLFVVAVLHDRLLFNPCKVERYVLTVIDEDYNNNIIIISVRQCFAAMWLAIVAVRNPPVVTGVEPLIGPSTASTVVTVSGRRLNSTTLRYVHYGGKYRWQPNQPRYNEFEALYRHIMCRNKREQ